LLQLALYIIERLISLYAVIMLIYCLSTWFIRDPSNRFISVLAAITEPPLVPIRRFLSRFSYFQNSPIDFSPLILFLLLRVFISLLTRLAYLLP